MVAADRHNNNKITQQLAFISGGQSLRSVLSKLDSKQQPLVLGHAVPMPVVVQTRAYDEQFYREIGDIDWQEMPDA